MSSNNRTMGDLFQQQRRGGGGGSSSHHHSRSPRPSQNNHRSGGGGGGRNRRNNNRQQQQQQQYNDLPLEQGVVCTLRDSFGFVHCADRPQEIFFHYSQVLPSPHLTSLDDNNNNNSNHSSHPANDLQLDQEVEFRVGPSARDADKLAAFQVRALPPGTIVWEQVQADKVRGIVERPVTGRGDNGTLRVVTEGKEEEKDEAADDDSDKNSNSNSNNDNQKEEGGVQVKFGPNDYVPPLRGAGRNTSNRLATGDLVEFTLMTERRTKEHFARKIQLIMSEKERQRQEEEKRMLAEATEEHGVITSLKGEYGFLRSNKRREEVYFHYSSIELEDTDHANEEKPKTDDDLVLKEGQDMKFLVVTEGGCENKPIRRISARRVSLQPRGSVKFHDVKATGVTGVVSVVPQPQDSGHALETKGKVRLTTPLKDSSPDGTEERWVTEVYLSSKDSPGGSYDFRGGSSVGLWVEVGDTVLFDVVKDFADGVFRAVPTKQTSPCDNPTDPDNIAANGHVDGEDQTGQAIRLIKLALPMRSEGVVNALKDTYGFIHFSERPVDAHFKLFQLLPEELQKDLRRNMGLADTDSHGRPLRLTIGAEVQYDMSVHGSIQSHSTRQHHNHNDRQPHERENLKAQRVLLLPPGTIVQSHALATNVQGEVTKDNPKQPYSGTVDLEKSIEPMTLEDRHPLVARMIEELLASKDGTKIVYHDLQSMKEDDVVIELIKRRGGGQLVWSHIPQASDPSYPGLLCIEKIAKDSSADDSEQPHPDSDETLDTGSKDDLSVDTMDPDGGDKPARSHRKRKNKASKPLKTIRFDKSNLVRELKEDMPPGVGDLVQLDVSQSRRTGQFQAENMTILQRHAPEVDETDSCGMGVVKEVVPARRFGFISVIDDTAANLEMLFFNLSSVVGANGGKKKNAPIRKGDEVKFNIGTEKSGKRVALNVTILPSGTIPNKADKNACRGLILLEPSHTSLKNTPLRHTRSNISQTSDKSSRWDSVDTDRKKTADDEPPVTEHGCVLLLEDPTGLFTEPAVVPSKPDVPALSDAVSDISLESKEDCPPVAVALKSHLHYKSGAIAIHGSGASSATDESSKPRRGDMVSFVKTRKSGNDLRDIRIVKRGAAALVRGHLESLSRSDSEPYSGTAKFVAKEGGKVYDISLSEVVSCESTVLKEKEAVEGILHDGSIYGVCRTVDLYLESKLGASHKERPKLNLTVKKDRGGKIMAQSMMAKGPEQGTNGFAPGWTKRMSAYAPTFVPNS